MRDHYYRSKSYRNHITLCGRRISPIDRVVGVLPECKTCEKVADKLDKTNTPYYEGL